VLEEPGVLFPFSSEMDKLEINVESETDSVADNNEFA
jgi:hypothetical protein